MEESGKTVSAPPRMRYPFDWSVLRNVRTVRDLMRMLAEEEGYLLYELAPPGQGNPAQEFSLYHRRDLRTIIGTIRLEPWVSDCTLMRISRFGVASSYAQGQHHRDRLQQFCQALYRQFVDLDIVVQNKRTN